MFKSNMSGAVDSESYKFQNLYTKSYSQAAPQNSEALGLRSSLGL